uniref:PAP-associated domain-containing protein n=1 Tax=Eptatretus burgeri TaxID=7764 RepID=A0A8C4Q1I4_EPTBU
MNLSLARLSFQIRDQLRTRGSRICYRCCRTTPTLKVPQMDIKLGIPSAGISWWTLKNPGCVQLSCAVVAHDWLPPAGNCFGGTSIMAGLLLFCMLHSGVWLSGLPSVHHEVDGQLEGLVQHMQLTEEDIRLRFLVCSLLQDLCTAILPSVQIQPFGSSVNLFGRVGCDLDMFLDLGNLNIERKRTRVQRDSSLEFQVKMFRCERVATQTILSVVGNLLQHISPSFDSIQKVLNARCPVLRFCHSPSNLNCDLTASNRIALCMSETLNAFAQVDARVRPLVFAIRCWARAQNLTSTVSGAWITNFSLTLLVLFFLQQCSPSVIPTISHLRKLADRIDHRVIDSVNCTIVSDLSKITPSNNKQSLEDLLHGFFDFYGSFPFQKKSINIRTGQVQRRSDDSPMEIINPFEENLNVSKNVNKRQLLHFVELSQNASLKLEKQHQLSSNQSWGLMTLLQHGPTQQARATDGAASIHPTPKVERFTDLFHSLWSTKQGNPEAKQQTGNSSPPESKQKGQSE